ncbi:MAG: hypothetical protein M8860_00575 [marine benthic group bacterium]|jgi:hypothetical protein|nr:hypothetical protein [Gemmatimonadota bacterium]MCL7961326.1 hypothetical protein [Candidatus Carthagonibacter metallireducens]MCL7966125.1 hypothetical protein [Gemmatimonadota bacterium]MCL7970428.1 hypothetical protein [Gemmatimonadota bacterium]MCL7973090.1 hypothetical protein [Gemmatimonadota bacterium]
MHRIKGAFFTLVIALFALPPVALAQDSMAGDWDVDVSVMGQQIPLVLHITKGEDGYEGKFDSPAQGGFDIPIRSITAEHPDFKMELETGGPPAILEGKHDGDTLKGSFTQATATGTFEGKRKAEDEETEGDGGR